jgi:integrase
LGPYGSDAANQKYGRLMAAYLSNGRQIPEDLSLEPEVPEVREPTRERPESITITTLVDRFMEWADRHYRHPDGTPTREADNFRDVTRPLKKMFGTLPVADFGPSKLIAFRDQLIKQGLARRTINARVRRVRQVFKWGIPRELVPIDVFSRLTMVEPLQANRGGRETSGSRGSVPWEVVQATIPHLPPLIQSLVLVAYHSGARIGELVRLSTRMVDTTEDPWVAHLDRHKTRHLNKSRRIYLGSRSQEALRPFLREDQPDEPIYSPLRVDERQEKRRGRRVSGRYYGRSSLQQVLRRGIRRAGVQHWTLGQLRHSAACRITDSFDIEVTRQVLGHATVDMSRHYASGADLAAKQAARTIG